MNPAQFTTKKFIKKLVAQMKLERESFKPLWQDVSDFVDPFRSQFDITDNNKGNRRASKIIDSTASQCSDILGAGLMSGITSPARPWFKLTTQDPDMSKFGKVKEWLGQVEAIMTASHLRSNLYSTLPYIYKDAGNFATAPFLVAEDKTGNVLHTTPFDIGSYMIGEDHLGRVNTFAREYRMTVQQLVEMFGQVVNGKADWSNFSPSVRNAYERGNTETWIEVTHCIYPNRDYNPKKGLAKFKKFKSIYYESNSDGDQFLRESGYDLFPVLGLRWGGRATDVYGTSSPAITSLGDIKQLQHGELRTAEALDKLVRPPMKASSNLKESGANLLPNGITWIDGDSPGNQIFESAYNIRFPFQEVETKQAQIRSRIEGSFYKNLFLMLANDQRSNITATEINARYEEKLVMLGPVLQQFNSDGLDPFIDLSFEYHLRQGFLPPPPEELQGMPLKIEYISVIAQAQKTIGINSDDRFLSFVTSAAGLSPEVLDKINFDEMTDNYGDKLSVNSKIIRTNEDVEALRAGRAQAQQQAAQMEQAAQSAKAVRDLSQADMSGDSALTQMAGANG